MEFNIYISPKLCGLLIKRGLSKVEFASLISITAPHLSRLIHHKAPVGVKTQKLIRQQFKNRPWEDLFTTERGNGL